MEIESVDFISKNMKSIGESEVLFSFGLLRGIFGTHLLPRDRLKKSCSFAACALNCLSMKKQEKLK